VTDVDAAVGAAFTAEWGRIVARMIRLTGDWELAEECAQDAFARALVSWRRVGVPRNPGAWLTTTARNCAFDRLRRAQTGDAKHRELGIGMTRGNEPVPDEWDDGSGIEDDRLRLIFTCCHPALAPENRIALTLRLLGGLTVAEIAHAFLVPETTMAQRITRAKAKIKQARIPYRVPYADDLPTRLSAVLAVLYLIFNEGYLSITAVAVRDDLCREAIRLTRQLRDVSAPLGPQPEVDGLLGLMLLLDARRPARVRDGVLVTLPDQDRSAWNAAQIAEGHALVRQCLALNRPGPYQIQAAINAVHTSAPDASSTDWSQVLALYDQLAALMPSPIVTLNRAVAVAELDGPHVALAIVDDLDLGSYHAFHATRADLLRRLGRHAEARAAYDQAIALTENPAEQAWLSRRRDESG
jgi:RNA polymerase sigma-70 factor (ECF subfamily)